MTIGLAILIAMILYLIDRNRVWKQAAKTVVVLALLAGIGVGGLFVWSWYQDRKIAREAARVQAQVSSVDFSDGLVLKPEFFHPCPSTSEWKALNTSFSRRCVAMVNPNKQAISEIPEEDVQAKERIGFEAVIMTSAPKNVPGGDDDWVDVQPAPKKPARPYGNGHVTADSAALTGSCGADFLTIVSFPTRIEALESVKAGVLGCYHVRLQSGRSGYLSTGEVELDKGVTIPQAK